VKGAMEVRSAKNGRSIWRGFGTGWLRFGFPALALSMSAALYLPLPARASADANAASCPSATEASPGFRPYLPDCRAYELVTPPYKEGALGPFTGEGIAAVSPDGDHVLLIAVGAFAGAENLKFGGSSGTGFDAYELSRGESGWAPTVLTPPASEFGYSSLLDVDPDEFGMTLWRVSTTTPPVEGNESIFVREPDGDFQLVGPGTPPAVGSNHMSPFHFVGASRDLAHVLFQQELSPEAVEQGYSNLWPGDTTAEEGVSLYEYQYHGYPDAEPTLVAVENEGRLRSDTEAKLIGRCGDSLGAPEPGYKSSGTNAQPGDAYNAVSASGETVFFTALHEDGNRLTCGEPGGAEPNGPSADEVYARVGGEHTVAISEPSLSTPGRVCTGTCEADEREKSLRGEAIFQGADEAGSKVFFLTSQPLVDEDRDSGQDLYMDELEGAGVKRVVQVSHDPNAGQAAEVQGVVRVAENGERVYFVAKGALTGPDRIAGRSPEEAEPQEGADNLYVFDTVTGATTFIGTLLTEAEAGTLDGEEEFEEEEVVAQRANQAGAAAREKALSEGDSGVEAQAAEEAAHSVAYLELSGALGPSGTLPLDRRLWGREDERPAQATPDGGFLLFGSSARLVAGDESTVPQVFEYDAERQRLVRVSIGAGQSFDDDGDAHTFDEGSQIPTPDEHYSDAIESLSGLALSEDGSRAFFSSGSPLTEGAESGTQNVYEYREGSVYLLSDGHDTAKTEGGEPLTRLFGIDPSGSDALFITSGALVPGAPEGQTSVYDAREGGGFAASAPTNGCAGETCRGALAPQPSLEFANSVQPTGAGNLPAPPSAKAKATTKTSSDAEKLAKALRSCRKKRRTKKSRDACEKTARRKYERGRSR
jgi:hypothetical protein